MTPLYSIDTSIVSFYLFFKFLSINIHAHVFFTNLLILSMHRDLMEVLTSWHSSQLAESKDQEDIGMFEMK